MIHISLTGRTTTRAFGTRLFRLVLARRGRDASRAPTAWLAATGLLAAVVAFGGAVPARAQSVAPEGAGFRVNASDLRFILQQIKIAETHAAAYLGTGPGFVPNTGATTFGAGPFQVEATRLPFGLRTVDGRLNNLDTGQQAFGAADILFPRMLRPEFRSAEPLMFPPGNPTTFASTTDVTESRPRTASNLIVDQSDGNPVAVRAAGCPSPPPPDTPPAAECETDFGEAFFIPNVAPDVGLSAPFNTWMTFFGQFFDHGLDLVNKGGNGTIFMPLKADDPLVLGPDGVLGPPGCSTAAPPTCDDLPEDRRFMVLTRATQTVRPGPDGQVGTQDDIRETTNQTSSFVDQSQTYTSHPAHQVFLREYETRGTPARPVSTGRMLEGRPGPHGGLATWGAAKAQAADLLGFQLRDNPDALNIPFVATDPYGEFVRGPNGFPQIVLSNSTLLEGDPAANGGLGVVVPADDPNDPNDVFAVRIGHAFLDDINRNADPTRPGYDAALLADHFVAGDGRVNENIALSAVHHVFHSEHNRLNGQIKDVVLTTNVAFLNEWLDEDVTTMPASPAGLVWDGERIFQAAKFITEMQYQHLVFEEFARKVQPQVNVFDNHDTSINSAIVAEFAHTVYRFGHSMLTETVARTNADGSRNDVPLLDAFLNPRAFFDGGPAGALSPDQATGGIVRGLTRQVGNEIDELITEALRNRLLGLPLDLGSINMARGRDTGVPPLNEARRQFYAATGDSALQPYGSWAEFGLAIRHPDALENYVAAYGTHPSITAATTLAGKRAAADALVHGLDADSLAFINSEGIYANQNGRTTTGVDEIDFWVGGLGEKQQPFGGFLGNTFNYVFETQMENLQDGDRFYYLTRLAGLNLLTQLEGNSFAELIERNSNATKLPQDAFSRPDFVFDLENLVDDPDTEAVEPSLLTTVGGRIVFNGPEHVVFNGTPGVDRIRSSEGDDTIRGNGGNDVLEAMAGNDGIVGGLGDDILTDSFGDDTLKGGDGDDVLSSGQGFDLNQGGPGSDYVKGGSDPTETLAGPGNDFVIGGGSADTVFGDDDDDWIQGGNQADLLQGDLGAPFQNDPNEPGNDVIIGEGGDDDYDSEGGDDIMVQGPGIERSEGMLGFDWVTHKNDPTPANDDMFFTGLLPDTLDTLRDRFDLTEAISGWEKNDTIRGENSDAASMVGNELDSLEDIQRITGLQALLGGDGTATSFTGGNILIGGAGSDLLEGRGGNDILDGDAWLSVQIDPDGTGPRAPVDNMRDVEPEVLAGTLDPGNFRIVREILRPASTAGDVDTAVFSGPRADYTVDNAGSVATVEHVAGTLVDGRDRLTNIERLTFSDQTIEVADIATNTPPTGTVTINNNSPVENQPLAVTASITDPDTPGGPIPASAITFTWQTEIDAGEWQAVNFAGGPSFTPTDLEVGQALRVVATFTDGDGVLESVTSAATQPVANVNDAPRGAVLLDDNTPQESVALTASTASIQDDDGLTGVAFAYQWQQSTNTGGAAATGWTNISIAGQPNADNGPSFVPTQAQVNRRLRLVVSYTDLHGTAEQVVSQPSTSVVGDLFVAGAGAFVSTAGDDVVNGGPTAETFNTGAGNDVVRPGGGDDTVNAGDGNDIVRFAGTNEGFDAVTGAAGTDTIHAVASPTVIGLRSLATVEVVTATETVPADPLAATLHDPVTINGSGAANTLNLSGVTLIGIDAIDGGDGNDTLTGSAGPNLIRGGLGNDTLNGGAAADVLVGNAGDDTVNGNGGDDVMQHTGTGDGFDAANGGAGTDRIEATANDTAIGLRSLPNNAGVEEVTANGFTGVRVVGSAAANTLSFASATLTGIAAIDGAAGNDSLTGSAAPNIIDGGEGNDTINGGAQDDTIAGNAGDDTINGQDGNDTVQFTGIADGSDAVTGGAGANDRMVAMTDGTLISLRSHASGAGVETITADGKANVRVVGSDLANNVNLGGATLTGIMNVDGAGANDTLVGTAGVDEIAGGDGGDTINGGGAGDKVNGGAGNDSINVGTGDDRVIVEAAFGTDNVTGFDHASTAAASNEDQDKVDVRSVGINAANFGARVTISPAAGGVLVAITNGTTEAGRVTVTGAGVNSTTFTQADFVLAP